jgi:Tol biopolymer transport system component
MEDAGSAKKIGVWGMSGLCFMSDDRILYSAKVSAESNEIWMMNSDGNERKQLTFNIANDTSPLASPDAHHVVFVSNRSGNFEIWRMNADGSNQVQLTNSRGATMPGISPDGRWVTYLSPGESKLYKIPLDGGAAIGLEISAIGTSAVSPDGKFIGYFFPGKRGWGIAVSSFEDGSAVKRFEYDAVPLNNRVLKWTRDGTGLLYASSSDGVGNIWMQPLDGSSPRRITDFKSDGIFHFDVSRDGKDLICARGGWKHDVVLIKNLR